MKKSHFLAKNKSVLNIKKLKDFFLMILLFTIIIIQNKGIGRWRQRYQ